MGKYFEPQNLSWVKFEKWNCMWNHCECGDYSIVVWNVGTGPKWSKSGWKVHKYLGKMWVPPPPIDTHGMLMQQMECLYPSKFPQFVHYFVWCHFCPCYHFSIDVMHAWLSSVDSNQIYIHALNFPFNPSGLLPFYQHYGLVSYMTIVFW